MMWTNPAEMALHELSHAPLVRFSVLAISSIFFLVDPFAAIPSFLAITEHADAARRKRMARKGALTCFIVLTSFAVGGQLIFRLFGITLPAFEIAGGMILLLIGLDMLQAKRSATQEASGDTEEASQKKTPASFRWEFPCWPARRHLLRHGACGPGAQLLALGDGCNSWLHRAHCPDLLLGAVRRKQGAPRDG